MNHLAPADKSGYAAWRRWMTSRPKWMVALLIGRRPNVGDVVPMDVMQGTPTVEHRHVPLIGERK
jgi:hypothetical protein